MKSERHSHDLLRDLDATGKRRRPVLPEEQFERPSGWLLWLAGLPGIVAVTLTLVPGGAGGFTPLSMPTAVALSVALLLALAVWLGNRCGPPAGLRAPFLAALTRRASIAGAVREAWLPGLLGGVAGAAILYAASKWVPAALANAATKVDMPLYARVLYGGITEELLLRWGVMSVVLWLAWKIFGDRRRRPGAGLAALAIVVSALAFAAGHLPAAADVAGRLDPATVAYVFAGNGAFGLVAGFLFWRRGLEAAMLAHALAHVFAWLALR
ncbi:MAG: CPBP family intramembrane metalloprotease [Burkholderiales bacterium]|nr:CPBP family intramembrane metalloprotease [Burkholderiales bacterium]